MLLYNFYVRTAIACVTWRIAWRNTIFDFLFAYPPAELFLTIVSSLQMAWTTEFLGSADVGFGSGTTRRKEIIWPRRVSCHPGKEDAIFASD